MKAEKKNWTNFEMEDKHYKECNWVFSVTNKQK